MAKWWAASRRTRWSDRSTKRSRREHFNMLIEEIKATAVREQQADTGRIYVNVCNAAGCQSLRSEELKDALTKAAAGRGLSKDSCQVRQVGCLGLCGAGPLVSVTPSGHLYQKVQPEDA